MSVPGGTIEKKLKNIKNLVFNGLTNPRTNIVETAIGLNAITKELNEGVLESDQVSKAIQQALDDAKKAKSN